MGKRKLYTENEIILCTYSAIYDADDFGGIFEIGKLTNRSTDSIKMKIQNIAAMLDEAGIQRFNRVPKLTGLSTGQSGRKTNWDIVKNIHKLPKGEFLRKCKSLV